MILAVIKSIDIYMSDKEYLSEKKKNIPELNHHRFYLNLNTDKSYKEPAKSSIQDKNHKDEQNT
jgi:hypothetical protein